VSFFEFVLSHHDIHSCQFPAEIYYFKPVGSRASIQLYVLISLPQQTVSVSLMFLVVVSYILGVFMETFIPCHGLLCYLNPVNQFALIHCFILRSFTGFIQQERKCFHCDHSKRLCQHCLRCRCSCSPAVSEPYSSRELLIFTKIVLQYHTQPWYLSVPTLLFSTSWVWKFLLQFQRSLTKF